MASRFISPTVDVGPGVKPASGAKLSFFATGTSTPKDTFTDSGAGTPNANPVIADSNGVFPDIFISGTYKVILKDKNDVQTGFGEKDPVKETVDSGFIDRLNPATLAVMIADNSIQLDDVLNVKSRKTGTGGAATWLTVLASTVTASVGSPGIGNIVLSTGGQSPALAFVLRDVKYPGATNIEEFINPRAWGAESTAVGPTSGFDNSPVAQLITTHATTNASGMIHWGNGRFYFASVVNIPTVNDGLGTNGITFQGAARNSTELFTDKNIDMFTHLDNFCVKDLTIIQRGADGVTKHTGVAFRANAQCRFCRFENLAIFFFKFGHLQRYSLWNYYKNISWNGNLCGVKLARFNDMEDQTNPGAVGPWNRSDLDGWFHNDNTFNTCVFNGEQESAGGRGEIGFWGAISSNIFINVTAQNYERDGSVPNETIPIGQVSTGFEIVGGGPTSGNSFTNVMINTYIERTFKGIKIVDIRRLDIQGFFVQGQAGGETMMEIDNSKVMLSGQTGQTVGFTNAFDLTNNSVLISDGEVVASGAAQVIEAGSFYSPFGIWTENGDIGKPTRKFTDLWLSGSAFFGTDSEDPKLTSDDGILIDGFASIMKGSRMGYTLDLNSRAVDGPVALFHRSAGLKGSLGVTNARGGAMENKMTGGNVLHTGGTASPEGVVAADTGSIYQRTDGGAVTSFYVKETGTGNTGWVAK